MYDLIFHFSDKYKLKFLQCLFSEESLLFSLFFVSGSHESERGQCWREQDSGNEMKRNYEMKLNEKILNLSKIIDNYRNPHLTHEI